MINNPDTEHGGGIYRIAQQMFLDPEDLVDFSSSINPLGPPKWVKGVLADAIGAASTYPDSFASGVRNAIAQHWNIDQRCVLVGNGSTELIFLAARAFHPKFTVVVGPTFSEYERAARLAGSGVNHVPMGVSNGFLWNPKDHEWTTISQSSMCYLCNPNNPSGTIVSRDFLREALQRCPKTLFVLDEAFIDFVKDPKALSLLEDCKTYPHLIVLRSFTKFYAIAGLRLGYAVAHPTLIRRMEEYKEPWSVNALAQAVGERLLGDTEFAQHTRAWLPAQRNWLAQELSNFSELTCLESQVNYLLLQIRATGINARDLFERLLKYRIVIRVASNFRGLDSSFFRVAVKTRTQNALFVESVGKVLSDCRELIKP